MNYYEIASEKCSSQDTKIIEDEGIETEKTGMSS